MIHMSRGEVVITNCVVVKIQEYENNDNNGQTNVLVKIVIEIFSVDNAFQNKKIIVREGYPTLST